MQRVIVTLCRFVALRNPMHRAAAAGASVANARAVSAFSSTWQRAVLGARPLSRAALALSPSSLSRRALTSAPYAFAAASSTRSFVTAAAAHSWEDEARPRAARLRSPGRSAPAAVTSTSLDLSPAGERDAEQSRLRHGAPNAATPGASGHQRLTDISGERFCKRERMSGPETFERVRRRGRTVNLKFMRAQLASNMDDPEATCTRIGIITAKKSFRRAVDRNLLRRRIRDVFRRNKSVWPERTDMVIVLSSGALEAPYSELEADMLALGRKAGERSSRAPRAGRQQQQLQQQPAQRPEQGSEQSKRVYQSGGGSRRDPPSRDSRLAVSDAASRKP